MNSVKSCIDPCTELGSREDKREMREFSRSGYSSGQSQLAIEDRTCACSQWGELLRRIIIAVFTAYREGANFADGVRQALEDGLSDLGLHLGATSTGTRSQTDKGGGRGRTWMVSVENAHVVEIAHIPPVGVRRP